MPLELWKRVVDNRPLEVGVKGVIVTGGGEPTVYKYLAQGLQYIRSSGLDLGMNTNGSLLRGSVIDAILDADPKYLKAMINAGSNETQRLSTGIPNFEKIILNLQETLIRKREKRAKTDISVGYVVNIVNVHDIMNFVKRMVALEEDLQRREGLQETVYSLQFRPVTNYESSKHFNEQKINEVARFLETRYGMDDRDEFLEFMFKGKRLKEGARYCFTDTGDRSYSIFKCSWVRN